MKTNLIAVVAVFCITQASWAESLDIQPYNPNGQSSATQSGVSQLNPKWAAVAIGQLNGLMSRSGQNLAASIQQITHPSGNSPYLMSANVLRLKDKMMVQITIGWQGGMLGNAYQTSLNWELDADTHIATKITGDTAMVGIEEANRKMLDSYFRDSIYPVFVNNMEAVGSSWR